jgi:hypothetical protein
VVTANRLADVGGSLSVAALLAMSGGVCVAVAVGLTGALWCTGKGQWSVSCARSVAGFETRGE